MKKYGVQTALKESWMFPNGCLSGNENRKADVTVFSPQEVTQAAFVPQNVMRGVCHKLRSNELQLFPWFWKVYFQ